MTTTLTPVVPTAASREAAKEALMEAWHTYLATLTPEERWARLA